MSRRFLRLLAAATFTLVPVTLAAPAAAHERRGQGDLSMVVGFGTEPAYAGQPNSVQVVLEHDGEPVTDLGGGLDVEVELGDQATALELEPFFGPGFRTPGDHRAWFIPTSPGRYTFHLSGEVDGERVDETFTSGPDTFSDVLDPAEIQFPEVNAPSTVDLATRIEREGARLREAIDALEAAVGDRAHAGLPAEGSDDGSRATAFGVAGLAAGTLALIVAVAAVVRSRGGPASS